MVPEYTVNLPIRRATLALLRKILGENYEDYDQMLITLMAGYRPLEDEEPAPPATPLLQPKPVPQPTPEDDEQDKLRQKCWSKKHCHECVHKPCEDGKHHMPLEFQPQVYREPPIKEKPKPKEEPKEEEPIVEEPPKPPKDDKKTRMLELFWTFLQKQPKKQWADYKMGFLDQEAKNYDLTEEELDDFIRKKQEE